MNLRTIPHLAEAFDVPTGLSDHTLGISVPVAVVALGACIIEKHFTLSRDVPGPDSSFSLEPSEFKAVVNSIRIIEESLGDVNYEITDTEQASKCFRRSLYAVADIAVGESFTVQNVGSIRPGYGLPHKYLASAIGRSAKDRVPKGTPLPGSS